MKRNGWFWTLVSATVAIYAIMLMWSIPYLVTQSGGLAIFDMRPKGYTFEEAKAFLSGLSSEGAEFYINVQHRLDIAFPMMLAVVTALSIWRLSPSVWGRMRLLLAATALPGMVFDYLENNSVAAMLAVGPVGVTREMVARASHFSQLKAAFVSISVFLMLILLAFWVLRRWLSVRAG
jgi:hypothetical protein